MDGHIKIASSAKFRVFESNPTLSLENTEKVSGFQALGSVLLED